MQRAVYGFALVKSRKILLDTCKVAVVSSVPMSNDKFRELLRTRKIIDIERTDQDFDHSLRLMLCDEQSGELGLLEILPVGAIQDEPLLDYKYTKVFNDTVQYAVAEESYSFA